MDRNDERRILIARALAKTGHAGQKDKCGKPYFEHVERVALKGETPSEKIVGYLHDIVEDGHTSHGELADLGIFSEDELHAIRLLDKSFPSTESYDIAIYYSRLKHNDLARRVKLADLQDNMDLSRFESANIKITDRDRERVERYQKHYNFLLKSGEDGEA